MRIVLAVLVLLVAHTASAQTPNATPTASGAPLQKLTLGPTTKTLSVGNFENYVTTGTLADGTTKNYTQKVMYFSSDSSVAVATNSSMQGQSKSRVEAIAIGTATISATDPQTNITSTASGGDGTLTVQGALVSLAVGPASKKAAVGDKIEYTTIGTLSDGNTRNMTQKVNYASSDTSVATCPNADGNKSQVLAVGDGTATISATDPMTNITSTGTGGTSATLTVGASSGGGGGGTPTPRATATICGDADASGLVTVSDGVEVLRAAAGLSTDCTLAICDVDGSGTIGVTDGVLVLRDAAGLDSGLHCAP